MPESLDEIHRKFFSGEFICTFRPKSAPKAFEGVGKHAGTELYVRLEGIPSVRQSVV